MLFVSFITVNDSLLSDAPAHTSFLLNPVIKSTLLCLHHANMYSNCRKNDIKILHFKNNEFTLLIFLIWCDVMWKHWHFVYSIEIQPIENKCWHSVSVNSWTLWTWICKAESYIKRVSQWHDYEKNQNHMNSTHHMFEPVHIFTLGQYQS